MYEKVNPAHPDKIADRIAGALAAARSTGYGLVSPIMEEMEPLE